MCLYLTRTPILQLVTAASCPITVQSLRRDWLCFPYRLCQEAEVLPASPHTWCASAFTLLGALVCPDCSMAWFSWYWGAQNDSRCSLRNAKWRGGITLPCVLAALLPIQASMLLAVVIAKENC